jgi:hypothetical protein
MIPEPVRLRTMCTCISTGSAVAKILRAGRLPLRTAARRTLRGDQTHRGERLQHVT